MYLTLPTWAFQITYVAKCVLDVTSSKDTWSRDTVLALGFWTVRFKELCLKCQHYFLYRLRIANGRPAAIWKYFFVDGAERILD